jgi:hypothetical protein
MRRVHRSMLVTKTRKLTFKEVEKSNNKRGNFNES